MPNLSLNSSSVSKFRLFFETVFIMCWMAVLADSDALHSIYSLCGIVSVFCLYDNYRYRRLGAQRHWIPCLAVSVFFSLVVALANYRVFQQVQDPFLVAPSTNRLQNLLNLGCCLLGGTFTANQILICLLARLPMAAGDQEERNHPWRVFWLVFACVVLIDLIYLFLDEYPGHVTPDSLDQILQGYRDSYINVHPFWHTYWIKLVLTVGYGIFGSTNAAVACFSILQIVAMAACFAYCLMTLYQAGVPKWCMAAAFGIYAFLPYNIAMSITMWKDVPFALACLIFVVSLYRVLSRMDKKEWLSYGMLAVGAMGMCLFRTNGMPSLMLSTLVFFPFLIKKNKKILVLLVVVLVVCIVLTGPVLDAIGVVKTDFTEALSIPLQQFARVVSDGCPLTDEETRMLSRIFDLEEIPELYTDWLSDPIKLEVRENDIDYLRDNILDYGKLWLQLLVKYPGEFVEAWVDQTKGYWNGGYNYHQYVEMMEPNTFGMAKTAGNNVIAKLFYLYFGLTRHSVFFQPLLSIGLHTWILAVCCFLNLVKGRKIFLLSVPVLCTVLSLLVGTPVFAEFRYAYAVFLTCPLILPLTLYSGKE